MSDQKQFSKNAIITALVMVVIVFIGTLIPQLTNTFEHEGALQNSVRVYASSHIKWEQSTGHFWGYFFLALTFLGCYGASRDWHEYGVKVGSKTERTWLAIVWCFAPIVISVIIFFAGYSASLDQGSKIIDEQTYNALSAAHNLGSLFK